jgi:RND family efflux transporter MFP subunit
MTSSKPPARRHAGWLRGLAVGTVFTLVVVVLMLWLAGVFHRKIDDTAAPAEGSSSPARFPTDVEWVEARYVHLPVVETAVGSVRAVHQATVASKLLAKVVEVTVQAGQTVREGEVLARLDDEDLQARVRQSEAALAAATASRDQARIERDRVVGLRASQSAAPIEMERATNALRSAEAEVERASQALTEAETILQFATIRSPIDGIVVDKQIEAGDTARPGVALVTLYDPQRMQLVAGVRESLTHRLRVGQEIGVRIDAMDKTCTGQVSEIVPESESASRSFLVKVTGPCPPGVYSGMFGRLLIPLDEEEVLLIPRRAVRRVGQLDIVEVEVAGAARRRVVQLGRTIGDDVEVLSGLRESERVALPPPGADSPAHRGRG